MSLYPQNIEEKLSFDQIRELIKDKCLSNLGVKASEKIRFTSDHSLLKKLLGQTEEFVSIIKSDENFPTSNFKDVSESLRKVRAEGSFLSETELLDISYSLRAVKSCLNFITDHYESYPNLYTLTSEVNISLEIPKAIEGKIDRNGEVKDNASARLQELRNDIKKQYSQVKKLVDKLFKESVKSGFVPEGASMTVRDGRMVIPIAAEYKRRVKGFIHDESSTGQTVFIEPAAVLEGNNEIRELENAEKREVIRILTALTDQIRENLPNIKIGYSFLAKVDLIRAKALFALEIGAEMPELKADTLLDWHNARHPLLFLSYQKQNKKVVPLTIRTDELQRLIVISGPNAGGKSVCLKTVGLLQYMLQCGLLVPMESHSVAGVYRQIFIDIGDEQSLDNDLSTYSSHLTNMKHFLRNADDRTLILIDEFGTGTDPQFGGAIAEGILHQLLSRRCQGVITTHYSNIKLYAEDREGIVNGAMKFDVDRLEPMYELELGLPGSSFSLEISRKIGLDRDVIEYARRSIGGKNVNVDDLILKLEKQEQEIEQRDEKLRKAEQQAKMLEEKYERLYKELEENKKDIINRAKEEASDILAKTNREIEKTIRHIKENRAQKQETKKARERLENLKSNIKPGKHQRIKQTPQVAKGPIAVGDKVKLEDKDVAGTVLDIKGKDVEVQIGGLKSMVKLNRLIKIADGGGNQPSRPKPGSAKTMDLARKRADFTTTLDLRGKRGEEALPEVDKFIDNALLFNVNEVKILHGKGDGILKDLVRQHLKGAPFIESMYDEHIERGGAGITVVELK
ncbi:MAG: endonuclease MutS2 [Fulvivirga sp.]|nr:endonuclease MutS2 [Fulvivirga sp.]